MPRSVAFIVCLAVLLPAGCGSGHSPSRPSSAPRSTERPGSLGASLVATTLARVADGPASQRRIAFVDPARVDDRGIIRSVLGRRPPATPGPAVTVAGRLVAPAARPETSAITPAALSAAQSCLGDTEAQAILGPQTMGADAALGVGLARSRDAPAGLQLRICGAPRLVRHIRAMERALHRRFAGIPSRIGEREIGEREIVFGTVDVRALRRPQLLRLLAAGPALRRLAWR